MRQTIEILAEKNRKLYSETKIIEQLDDKIYMRLLQNQRQTTLNETRSALLAIEINAAKRITEELFIYAKPTKAKIVLNANQIYNFKLITLQEIELKTMFNPYEGIKSLWNKTNRLTIYSDFIDRTERLLKKIQSGELDEYVHYSTSELLYKTLGENGDLLEQLGIDKTISYTTTRINQILQRARDNLRRFNVNMHKD
jgi:hypothetical protein